MSDDLIFTREKRIGVVTLNRPKALNALSLTMIQNLQQQLKTWEQDEDIHAVVVCSTTPSAFCAGGDVRWLYDSGLNKNSEQLNFFQEEYNLNQYIADYPKPYIALMDGVTMGGGVGISLHGSHSVASEKFLFAMPETGIGFFPDIGASYLLSRCPDNFGVYLGLIGARLNATDAHELGLVTNAISSSDFANVIASLIQSDLSVDAHSRVTECLANFKNLEQESTIAPIRTFVADSFSEDTVEDIILSLEKIDDKWHQTTISHLEKKSPKSLKITLKQILEVKDKPLSDCLAMDLCLVTHFMQDKDFYEGVRALLVDKDKSPKWSPGSLQDVSCEMVDAYFS
ncbi:MAG: enoyl-CoA hydratase/isomerase family protein [Legionellaceae bacterium]|nr:enoyl-CoA hydratase/isomerase family protein [Legionellaceae bacterium]